MTASLITYVNKVSQELWILDHSFKQGWKLEEEVETCTKGENFKIPKINKKTKQNSAGELENAEYPLTYDLH